MIIRIVRLSIQPEKATLFQDTFWQTYDKIRNVEGCTDLQLHRDTDAECVFITFSIWKDPSYLEAYRNSALFKQTWDQVKPLFSAKAEAFSMKREVKP
jgi:quinol monooxygenase YgiN